MLCHAKVPTPMADKGLQTPGIAQGSGEIS